MNTWQPLCEGEAYTCIHLQNDRLSPVEMQFSENSGASWRSFGMLDSNNSTQTFRKRGELWRLLALGCRTTLASGTTFGKTLVLRAPLVT